MDDDKEDIQHPISPPEISSGRPWALPLSRRWYPAGIVWELYEEHNFSVIFQYSENDPYGYEWDHGMYIPYHDDPEFTGFDAGRYSIPESYGTP